MYSHLEIKGVLMRIEGRVICDDEGEKKVYTSGNDAIGNYGENYVIESIYPDGDAVVLKVRDRTQEIEEIRRNALKEYKERTGKDFSYFDC